MRFKSVFITVAVATALSAQEQKAPTGYTDTPTIPGSKWRVHDDARPRPPVITPGTCSTVDMPGKPPSDAVVLFDGTSLAAWRTENGEPAKWKVENGYMEVAPGAGDIWTRQNFGDSQLHVEFRTPSPPKGDSQGRGNSGVLLYGIYEIQVLDSFNNLTYADGQASAVYGSHRRWSMPPALQGNGKSTTSSIPAHASRTEKWTCPAMSPSSTME
jgi:hypothetical protein